jgi:phosphoribosylaminoimidazole (AIR) synthetase
MDRVFNRGIGMTLVVDPAGAGAVLSALAASDLHGAVIGEVVAGSGVRFA